MASWSLLPTVAVRTTGFPAEMLTQLRFPETTCLIRSTLEVEAALDQIRVRLLGEQFPSAVSQARVDDTARSMLTTLSKWRRAVGRRRKVAGVELLPPALSHLKSDLFQWNTVCEEHEDLLAKAQTAWELELGERRVVLRTIAVNPQIQEALLLSNPSMYPALQRYLYTPGTGRAFERRFVLYLQRLCLKNETQSFFGPINYGRLDEAQESCIVLQRSSMPLRRRVTFPSQWMAESLAAVITADHALQSYLRPRRGATCTLDSSSVLRFPGEGKSLALSTQDAQLFTLANGHRTTAELAELLGENWDVTWARIVRLQRRSAILVRIIIPNNLSNPLTYIQHWLEQLPETLAVRKHWSAVIGELQQKIATFACSNLVERVHALAEIEACFSKVCPVPARRGEGVMYSDRLLLYEECLGDLTECVLGGALMRAMSAQLSPILQLSEAYARLRAERDQRILRSIWQRIEPKTGGSIGFLSYLHFLASNHYRDISPTADTLDEFLEELHSLVQRHSDGRRACLRSSDLPRPALQSDDSRCLYSSIDLLIAAPNVEALQAGQFQLVLGECHPQPLLWVFPTAYFLEEPSTLATPINEYLGTQSGSSVSAQIAFSRKSKIFPYVLPGYVIELRPHYPDCQAIPAAEVQIRDVDGRLSLWAGATRLQLYSPLTRRDTGADPLAPFALPGVEPPLVDMGDHTPRIEIDNIVYQRERWVVTSESLADIRLKDFDRFLDLWRWKSRLNLPDEIFVRIQGEPKPIYIDLTNYFLADLLDRLARKTSKLVITEMVPNTEELWLDGREGQHSSELRIMAFRPSTE